MANETRPTTRDLTVELDGKFQYFLYFNRFRIERMQDVAIFHVACGLPDAPLGDTFSCAIGFQDLKNASKATLTYLDRIEKGEKSELKQVHVPSSPKIHFANVISSSYSGNSGEIALHTFSLRATAEAGKNAAIKKLNSQGVAILRSPLDVHIELLFMLFQ